MDVYGNALMESKRAANSKVVNLLLRFPRDPNHCCNKKGAVWSAPQQNLASTLFPASSCGVLWGRKLVSGLPGADLNRRPLGYAI